MSTKREYVKQNSKNCPFSYSSLSFSKLKNFKAFTLSEAILAMTILGIIAAVMITTIKPYKYKA